MKRLITTDGSVTFYSDEFGECYHSQIGAISEAFAVYVEPCQIEELASQGKLRILDIGFGLGYNSAAAIYQVQGTDSACKLEIIGIENDSKVLGIISSLSLSPRLEESYEIVKQAAKLRSYSKGNISLRIILDDARKVIQDIGGEFDCVFLDPFSPPKNPELWTVDFLTQVYRKMKKEAVLSTYSAASAVRSGLLSAGFRIGRGPATSLKREGTLASPRRKLPRLSAMSIALLVLSDVGVPYRDPNLNSSREEIVKRRKEERREKKERGYLSSDQVRRWFSSQRSKV